MTRVKAQIAALIEQWIKDGTLEKYSETDDSQRKEKVFVRPALAEDDDNLDFG